MVFGGSPILTILFVLYLVGTPISTTIQSELDESDNIIKKNPFLSPIIPSNIGTSIATLLILFSVKPIELVSGTLKTVIIIAISYLIDVAIRTASLFAKIDLNTYGPISILACLLFLYSITFPTIKSKIFPANEKIFLLVLLASTVVFNGIYTIIPILCGFVSFALLSPLITSKPKSN